MYLREGVKVEETVRQNENEGYSPFTCVKGLGMASLTNIERVSIETFTLHHFLKSLILLGNGITPSELSCLKEVVQSRDLLFLVIGTVDTITLKLR